MFCCEYARTRLSLGLLLLGGLALLAVPAWTEGQDAPAAVKTAAERDRKIRDLEVRVEALLKELRALKSDAPRPKPTDPSLNTDQGRTGSLVVDYDNDGHLDLYVANVVGVADTVGPVSEVRLTRATYKLPASKAEALATFLRDHVKASVLETKAEGDTVMVTTTPEAQHVIGQLIALMQGKTPRGYQTGTSGNHQPAAK
jgi:hypothetical protein